MNIEFEPTEEFENTEWHVIKINGRKTNLEFELSMIDKTAKIHLMSSDAGLSYNIPVEKLGRKITVDAVKKFVKDNINEIIKWYNKSKEDMLKDIPPLMRTNKKTVWIEIEGVVKWQKKIDFNTIKSGSESFSYSQKPLSRKMIYEKAIKMAETNHPLCFWTKYDIINLKHKGIEGCDEKSSADVLALRINNDMKTNPDTPFFRYSVNPERFGLIEDKKIYKRTIPNLDRWD